jgi:hypothetical protein
MPPPLRVLLLPLMVRLLVVFIAGRVAELFSVMLFVKLIR